MFLGGKSLKKKNMLLENIKFLIPKIYTVSSFWNLYTGTVLPHRWLLSRSSLSLGVWSIYCWSLNFFHIAAPWGFDPLYWNRFVAEMCIYPQHWGFPAFTEPSASPATSLGIFEVRRGENSAAWSSLAWLLPYEHLSLEGEGSGQVQIVFVCSFF